MDTCWAKSGQLFGGNGESSSKLKNSVVVGGVKVLDVGPWYVRNSKLVSMYVTMDTWAGCVCVYRPEKDSVENWPWMVGVRGGIWVGSIEYWDYYNYQSTL